MNEGQTEYMNEGQTEYMYEVRPSTCTPPGYTPRRTPYTVYPAPYCPCKYINEAVPPGKAVRPGPRLRLWPV